MKFEDICSKIISEAKNKKEKDTKTKVDGEKDKPEVIAETDVKPEEAPIETPVEEVQTIVLDEIEKEFLEKFIEFTELSCLVKCQKSIEKDFKSILGKNNAAISDFLTTHNEERNNHIDELKVELTSLRQQVREKEKANVESAERKLSLVSLLDKAVKAE